MSGEVRKVLFVLQVIGHPRDSKRIKMVQDAGFSVEALAFQRDYHKGCLPSCNVRILGYLRHRQYLERISRLLRALPVVREAMRASDVIYASGQDVAFLALLASYGLRRPIVMEVGDLVDIQVQKGAKGWLVRKIDAWISKRYDLLVVISPAFLNTYYREWLRLANDALVLENKLERHVLALRVDSSSRRRPAQLERLRIGYFGLLRDRWSWEVLRSLASLYPDRTEVIFAGKLLDPANLDELVKGCPNMRYLGEYRSPQDLPRLYGQVDMVWACYPDIKPDDWNLRWGRPNRFYESCLFLKPCFARKGCHFGDDVENRQLGLVIESTDVSTVARQISEITAQKYNVWVENIRRMPASFFTYSDEGDVLAKRLTRLADQAFTVI